MDNKSQIEDALKKVGSNPFNLVKIDGDKIIVYNFFNDTEWGHVAHISEERMIQERGRNYIPVLTLDPNKKTIVFEEAYRHIANSAEEIAPIREACLREGYTSNIKGLEFKSSR